MFSFKTYNAEKKAAEYAAAFDETEQAEKEAYYLDSIQNKPIYNFLGLKKFTYKECKEKEVNLGLDLKGGMNVMLEIEVQDLVKSLAGDSQDDPAFVEAMNRANEAMKAGTNDYIGVFAEAYREITNGAPLAAIFVGPDRKDITPNSTDEEVVKVLKEETDAAIAASFNILRNRIDHFGVTQPNIQRLPNSNRILVELPGVKEPERVRKLLQGSASLEFWTTFDYNEVLPLLSEADRLIKSTADATPQSDTVAVADAAAAETAEADSTSTAASGLAAEVAKSDSTSMQDQSAQSAHFTADQNPLFAVLDPYYGGGAIVGAATAADIPAVNAYLARPDVQNLFPSDLVFKWGIKGEDMFDGRYALYALRSIDGKPAMDGGAVATATETYAERGATAEVNLTMTSAGTSEWAQLTGQNVGKAIAIVLDGYVYSAPRVEGKIDGGNSRITGNFTIQEAQDLANVLKSGKVPAPARIIQDTVVGPSLGAESINAGMFSFVLAFVLVLLYMGLFYKTAGWMADVALILNVFLLMGVLVSFGAVLTLPGIAGIVLTMGMAVDANVIIYERIKEELRGGKGLSLAIKDGFSKAYSAIIDGNLTTIITGIVLFIFGNGPVQGFATTLIIGIITSFFSAVFITRLLIEWIVAKWGNISFSRKWSENFLTNTHFDFIRVRKVAYTVSVALLALSCISFVARGLNLGAEFTGGRAYVIRFDKPVSAEEVRQNLGQVFAQHADADASAISFEVKQYGNENQMRIVTQYRYDDTSDEATAEVEQIIYDAMKSLYSYDISFEQFRNTQTDVNGILTADKIGPSIAKDMTWNAIYSVLFSLIAIGLYITFRFKRWQWASGATIALAVNALFIIGLFSMLYGFVPFNLEVNQAFIAAILTIIGYAINDTVVVFDRIREYLGMYPKRNLKENVNNAINSTLSRTINTSGTTLVTLLAIFFFGGETIRGFIFALTVGVIVGTVATIFIATPIAYDLMSKRAKFDKEA
ncbi:MAG: protein translocase subunit SecDF [Alistipes sp. 58_9_plus]|nr:MAG: protein translocase subunit SecDF [Alistipes sp. 58_9_plus]